MLSKSGCPLQRQSWPSCDAAGAQGSCAHGCWRRVTCKFHSALESGCAAFNHGLRALCTCISAVFTGAETCTTFCKPGVNALAQTLSTQGTGVGNSSQS